MIVSSGRDVPWKGFETLKQAVEELGEDYELRIVHNMPHNEYLRVLKSADVFVLNTGYEGFAHAIIEAMAVSKPVIVTNIWSLNELVQDRVNGLLVEPKDVDDLADAIEELLVDKALYDRVSKNGAEMVRREFSIAYMAERVDTLYQQVLARPF